MMERFITAPVIFGGTPDADGLLLDAQMKPDPDYRPGDWRTYRDEGRR